MSRRRQTWSSKTPTGAFSEGFRGFRHVGVRRTKVSFDTALCGKVEDDGHEMPSASLVRRCRHLMALQTTCSVFGARGLQTHRATGAPCAPWKIASSSYRMKARDLTSGLPALPVGLSEILQTANQRSVKSRSGRPELILSAGSPEVRSRAFIR